MTLSHRLLPQYEPSTKKKKTKRSKPDRDSRSPSPINELVPDMPAVKKKRKPGIQIEREGSATETDSFSESEPTDEIIGSADESSEVEQAESEIGSSEDDDEEEEVKEVGPPVKPTAPAEPPKAEPIKPKQP